MRFFFDAVIFILLVPVLFILAYQNGLLDGIVPDDAIPADPFVRAELAQTTSASDLSRRIDKALDAGNFDDAVMYADVADYMGAEIEPGTASRLEAERSLTRTVSRNTGSFFEGFIVGDVRDIGQEGTKLVQGQDYSKLVLGLSVVGLAATTATIATGGGALPARVGVSLLKVAEKAGTVTVRFGRDMARILGEAVNFEKLKSVLKDVNLADTSATRHAVTDYANGVSMARVTPVLGDVAALERSVGPAESVRLLKYVNSEADLERVTKMSAKLGGKTRGVIEITGKTSLRAFKTVANLILWVVGWGWAFAAALGAAFLGAVGRRLRRRPARA